MKNEFPLFRKDQGEKSYSENIFEQPQGFFDTLSTSTSLAWDEGITSTMYRKATGTDEGHDLFELEKEYKESLLDKSKGFSAGVAQATGWVAGTFGDPTEAAMLAASFATTGGVGYAAARTGAKLGMKQLAQKGLAKRVAKEGLTGAVYGGIKETVQQSFIEDESRDDSALATVGRVAGHAALFPVASEGLRLGGKAIKGIFAKKTGSAYLDSAAKVESVHNTSTKLFVDESLPEFSAGVPKSLKPKLDAILKQDVRTKTEEQLIADSHALQDLKMEARGVWAKNSKELQRVNLLEDTLAEGKAGNGARELELELLNLKEKYSEQIIVRDNQEKLLDTLVVNRNILSKEEQQVSQELAEVVDWQIENGKQVNTNGILKAPSKEAAEMNIMSEDMASTPFQQEASSLKFSEGFKEAMPAELINEFKLLGSPEQFEQKLIDLGVTDKGIRSLILKEAKPIVDIYKKQLMQSQVASENLVRDLSAFKDIKRGLSYVTDRVGNEGIGYFSMLSNNMFRKLEKENLVKVFEKHSNLWGKELAKITNKELPASGFESAKRVAEILYETNSQILVRAKNAGHDITELAGRVAKQTHDKLKIRKEGFTEWYNYIKPLLDPEKTDISREALFKSFGNIINPKGKSEEGVKLAGDEYIMKMAKRLGINIGNSSARSLHFKSTDAGFLYNQKYGTNGWSKQFVLDLESLSHKTIQAEQLGVYPENALRYAKGALRKSGQELPENFIDQVLQPLKLTTDRYSNQTSVGAHMDKARAYTSLCMLGKSALSSIPDAYSAYSTMRHIINMPVTKAMGQTLKGMMYMFDKGARKKSLELTNAVMEGTLADMYNRLGMEVVQTGSKQGKLNKMAHLLYKINGQHLWDESMKTGIAEGTAKYMVELVHKDWRGLPTAFKNSLQENGITKSEWGILGAIPSTDGHLISGAIKDAGYESLASKYQGFITDIAHKGIPTGIRATDRHIMTGHKGVGNSPVLQEFATAWLQFKHFPIMFARHALAPLMRKTTPLTQQEAGTIGSLKALGRSPSAMAGVAQLITITTMLEYFSYELKAVIAGKKKLEDTFNPTEKDVKHILSNGAGVGVYQSILSLALNPNGMEVGNQLKPASASPIITAGQVISKIGGKDFVPNLLHKGTRALPFNNLFYTEYLLKKNIEDYVKSQYPSYHRKKYK